MVMIDSSNRQCERYHQPLFFEVNLKMAFLRASHSRLQQGNRNWSPKSLFPHLLDKGTRTLAIRSRHCFIRRQPIHECAITAHRTCIIARTIRLHDGAFLTPQLSAFHWGFCLCIEEVSQRNVLCATLPKHLYGSVVNPGAIAPTRRHNFLPLILGHRCIETFHGALNPFRHLDLVGTCLEVVCVFHQCFSCRFSSDCLDVCLKLLDHGNLLLRH